MRRIEEVNRIIETIDKNGKCAVFYYMRAVRISKLSPAIHKKIQQYPNRFVGIYDDSALPKWVEDDLIAAGVNA